MPPRSSSSKTSKDTPVSEVAEVEELESAPAAKKTAKKKEVLSLIDEEKPAKTRGTRKEGTALPPIGAKSAPEIAAKSEVPEVTADTADSGKMTVDDQKKAALNLFEEDEKPKVKRTRTAEAATTTALPPISRLKDAGPVAGPVAAPVIAPPPKPAAVEPAAPEFEVNESGEKIIHLKPPVIVKDLAEKMGLRPFKVIADLINLKVFVANADKAIELDVAEKVCEKHGFRAKGQAGFRPGRRTSDHVFLLKHLIDRHRLHARARAVVEADGKIGDREDRLRRRGGCGAGGLGLVRWVRHQCAAFLSFGSIASRSASPSRL